MAQITALDEGVDGRRGHVQDARHLPHGQQPFDGLGSKPGSKRPGVRRDGMGRLNLAPTRIPVTSRGLGFRGIGWNRRIAIDTEEVEGSKPFGPTNANP